MDRYLTPPRRFSTEQGVLRKSPSGVHDRLARQRDARGGTKELTECALDDTTVDDLGILTLVVSD